MFEQLQPEGWLSKVSLRGAILSAIGWGFNAGLAFGILFLTTFRLLPMGILQTGVVSLWLALSTALATRFYFLTTSRVQEHFPRPRG